MIIRKIDASNYCGGFKPPKGHLDTQMFPECEGYETDRNIVRKTVEKREKAKKKKKKKKASIKDKIVEAKIGWPISGRNAKGIWEQWKNNEIEDKDFVDKMMEIRKITGFPGLTDDLMIREAVIRILDSFPETLDYVSTAMDLGKWLAVDVERETQEEKDLISKFNLKHYKES